jgi:hypothetical protein
MRRRLITEADVPTARRSLAQAALLVIALTGCASHRAILHMPAAGVQVPFELVHNWPLVHVRVGRRHTDIAGVLDTGAQGLSISPEGATQAHLAPRPRALSVSDAHVTRQRTITAARASLTLGNFEVKGAEVFVFPELSVAGELEGRAIDLIFGGPMLGPFLVTLDYPRRQLRIAVGSLPAPNGRDVLDARFIDGLPHIRIVVAGVPLTAMLDSGCNGTIYLPVALSKTLPLRGPPLASAEHHSANGGSRGLDATLDGPVQLGGYSIIAPDVFFAGTEALVCGRVLREFAVTFDPAHGRARFARGSFAPIVLPPSRSLGFGLRKREGKWTVADLASGRAPPEVQLGDEIVSYDGHPCADLTRDDMVALRRKANVIHLVLRRAGRLLDLDAPVHEL